MNAAVSSFFFHFFSFFLQELRQLAHNKAQQLAGQEGELPDGGKGYSENQSVWQRF